MKPSVWRKAKKRLKKEYQEKGITTCEGEPLSHRCMYNFALSFHHLDKRSSGKAKNTFKETRLLCAQCHHDADHGKNAREFNEKLRQLR